MSQPASAPTSRLRNLAVHFDFEAHLLADTQDRSAKEETGCICIFTSLQMHLSRCHRVIAGAARPCWSRANLAALPLAIHAAAHAHAQAMPISAHGTRLYKRHFSASSGGSSSSSSSSFLPSQTPIIMPRLAPRMEYGRVAQWLVSEGDEIKPLQVFMLIETDDLTEDGSSYLLEIESHEGGVLRRILRPAGTDTITVDTPLAVFEDPDWQEGEPARGDFLWQAYAKKGAVQSVTEQLSTAADVSAVCRPLLTPCCL